MYMEFRLHPLGVWLRDQCVWECMQGPGCHLRTSRLHCLSKQSQYSCVTSGTPFWIESLFAVLCSPAGKVSFAYIPELFFQGKETKWTGLNLAESDATTQYLHASLRVNCFPRGVSWMLPPFLQQLQGRSAHTIFILGWRRGREPTSCTWSSGHPEAQQSHGQQNTAHYPQLTRAGATTLCLAPDMAAQRSHFNLQSADKPQTLGGQRIFRQLLKP